MKRCYENILTWAAVLSVVGMMILVKVIGPYKHPLLVEMETLGKTVINVHNKAPTQQMLTLSDEEIRNQHASYKTLDAKGNIVYLVLIENKVYKTYKLNTNGSVDFAECNLDGTRCHYVFGV